MILSLEPEIYKYEPLKALDGGEDGLFAIRDIINFSHLYLKSKGWLMLETGHDQKEKVLKIIDDCGEYDRFGCTKDYSGYDRVVQMRKKNIAK